MWLVYTLLSVFAWVTADIGSKYILDNKNIEPFETVLIINVFVLIALILPTLKKIRDKAINNKKIIPNKIALKALIMVGILGTLASYLFMKMLDLGDFSIVMPIRHTTPVFSLLLGIKILKEKIGPYVKSGTLLLVLGVMVLSVTQRIPSEVDSEQKTFVVIPVLLALIVAVLTAFMVLENKRGTAEKYGKMDPLLFTTGNIVIMVFFYSLIALFASLFSPILEFIVINWRLLLFLGALGATASWASIKAYSIGKITQISPLIRTQILIGVILGGTFFQEEYLLARIIAATLILLGVIMVIIPPKKLEQG